MNENYVRLNMKYKSYSRGRGPGRMKGEAYKRHVWKQRQKGELGKGRGGGAGRGRGRGGGKPWLRTEDTCFKCGGKGHWASQCNGQNTSAPKKDIEEDWAMKQVGDDEEFPTLEEAALAAAGIKPDKEAIAKGLMTAPTVMPPVYEEPVPPPPIEPLLPLNDEGKVIDTPESVMDALRDIGYTSFRQGQEHSIMRILSGLSTLVVLSTGAGKSLTYQLPAYIYAQRSPCITLVISPLVSLMDDQIFGLPKCLKGARLHSNMTKVQREKVVKEIAAGNVNVLLVSPEAIVGGGRAGGGCLPSSDKLPPIAFACIDEVHCVSEWSHNFRPSYLMLCRVLRERLGVKCLLGLTATATMATANSVAEHLGIAGDSDAVVRGSSVPNNLMLSVSRDPNRERAIVSLLEGDRFCELDSIIVYCIRRDETERVASLLRTCLKADTKTKEVAVPMEDAEEEPPMEDDGTKKKGRKKKPSKKKKKSVCIREPPPRPPGNSAESYHAGMSPAQRRKIQNAFMTSKLRIVVATVAFGMGLDKADVRAVIHYNLPKSYESYVQEIGRAGRDGKPSHCHVFLEPEGSDLCELRRHTYANSIDRIVIKKLVNKLFPPCKCRQLQNLTSEETAQNDTTNDNQSVDKPETSSPNEPSVAELESVLEPWEDEDRSTHNASVRLCPGHQVAIPNEATVQELDIKEESIATLLCYLELHNKRWVRNLPPLYATCNVICYGGPTELRATAKKCPPLAVAIARQRMRGKDFRHIDRVEFNAVEVASSMGWDVWPVKKELRQLQWKQIPGRGWVKSGVLVEFSELALSVRAPGDMTDDDFDEVIQFLAERTKSQEQRELYNLQSVYLALHSVSCKHYGQCCDSINEESSNKLKELLREYFRAENAGLNNHGDVAWFTPDTRQKPEAQEGQVRADVRQFVGLHTDRTFTGRAVARIFHGIASPCYPAQVWGRDRRFWRRHLDYDFSKLVKIATEEVLRMR
ncbi:ATP-dependent DNA helicase Q4-like [Amphiura filiformis]|uniref:ATP-dependent DNA helicase Q4-like n=1 Tax=Amphiura filiformis TaxID=82378 RepID=UPI003B21512A